MFVPELSDLTLLLNFVCYFVLICFCFSQHMKILLSSCMMGQQTLGFIVELADFIKADLGVCSLKKFFPILFDLINHQMSLKGLEQRHK